MKQILIIEDDPRIAGLERDYLEAAGLQASVAADGPSGLRTALDGRFDLILLDIMLPGMDGLEVCRSIRREQNVPIILVSAKKEDLDKIKGLGVGADDYVVKPFSPASWWPGCWRISAGMSGSPATALLTRRPRTQCWRAVPCVWILPPAVLGFGSRRWR